MDTGHTAVRTGAGTGTGLRDEADATYNRVLRDPARYAARAEDLVSSATAAGDAEALVTALRAVAWVRHVRLDNAGARALLDRAVRLAGRHGLRRRLGDVLMTRAVALHELGRYDAAARDLRRAEPLVAYAERPEVRFQLAVLDHNRGRVAAAAAAYGALLDAADTPPFVRVKAANNLAHVQTMLGRPQEALAHLDRAAVLARDLGARLPAVLANTAAWSSYHAGRLTESVRRFEEAGRLHAAAGLPLGEHHLEYADVLRDLRLLDEAERAARTARVEFERHGARLMAADARLRCARLALERGDAAAALADAQAAAADFRRQRRPAWAARAAVTEAEAGARLTGHDPDVLRRLRRAAAALARLGLREEAAYAHLAAGRSALALGRREVARASLTAVGELAAGQSLLVRLRGHLARALLAESSATDAGVLSACRAGLHDLARHRTALPSLELRVLASGHGAELGELGLRTLLPSGSAGRVLSWLERTRSAALLRVQPSAAGGEQDVVALRGVAQELREARLTRGEEPAALLARQHTLESRIRRRSWSREQGTGNAVASPATAGQLRRALDGRWLIEYAVVSGRALAVVVEPRRTRIVELGDVAAIAREVAAAEFAVRRLLGGTRFAAPALSAAREAVAALARLLVAPVGVPPEAPLVVVPSTHLTAVPWSALHPAPVSVSPSGGLWAHAAAASAAASSGAASSGAASSGAALSGAASSGAASAGRNGGNGTVVVVAGPDLEGAAGEVKAVAAEYEAARTLLPPESTAAAAIALVRDAGLAHFACHGRFRSDSPLFSSLELSDGPLTLFELLAHGVAPRRVVLASCQSGAHQAYGGDEVLGFAGAMMSHGSAGVVAADLPVPDGACATAMTALHRSLARGDDLPAAVWHARAALADGGAEEYVAWFGLTAYGPG